MGMFDTYDNLQDNYIPSTMPEPKVCTDKLQPLNIRKPYEQYNAEGELIGYWWNYGDAVNLEFNISGYITVTDDAIVYTAVGEIPTTQTFGFINQKAYNVVDKISWTCTGILDEGFIWTQDEEFEELESGGRNIYITAQDFLQYKQITVQLYNFRREQLDIQTFKGNHEIVYKIDKELSKTLKPNVYYLSLTVWDDEGLNKTIFAQQDCTLVVK